MPETDFTSAHFLGLAPSGTSAALTSGRPAAVEEPEAGTRLARRLAGGQDAGDGVLARTSLHGLLDVLATRPPGATILVDEAIYPLGRWAALATAEGADVLTYRHHDPADAARRARRHGCLVLVTDGLCVSCLRPAPLGALGDVVGRTDGELVVDDTLAAGVLGCRSARAPHLGTGGGGTAAWLGEAPVAMVTVSSLAKGLSSPVAVVTGSTARVHRLRTDGPTRMHASPPTSADVAALAAALGNPGLDRLRSRLTTSLLRVRHILERLELSPLGLPFPLVATHGGLRDPLELQRALAAAGVRSLATTGRCTGRPTLSVCVRADHTPDDVAHLDRALTRAVRRAA